MIAMLWWVVLPLAVTEGLVPLQGPHPSLRAGCAQLGLACATKRGWAGGREETATQLGYKASLFVARPVAAGSAKTRYCMIAIETPKQEWFVTDARFNCSDDKARPDQIKVVSVIAGAFFLFWRHEGRHFTGTCYARFGSPSCTMKEVDPTQTAPAHETPHWVCGNAMEDERAQRQRRSTKLLHPIRR